MSTKYLSAVAGFHYQSCTFQHSLFHSGQVVSSVSFRQHVQISIAARDARSPAQCDCLEAFLDHCAATQDLQELEELGRKVDTGWWTDLLLQHLECVRRGASLYVYHRNAHRLFKRSRVTDLQTPFTPHQRHHERPRPTLPLTPSPTSAARKLAHKHKLLPLLLPTPMHPLQQPSPQHLVDPKNLSRRLANRALSTRRLARSTGTAHAWVVWHTALAASNSGKHSAALSSPRTSPRALTASTSSRACKTASASTRMCTAQS